MAQEIRANTQTIVIIGPAVAVADGFTPVTTLALTTADEAELLKANTTTTTDISGATIAAITGGDGYYGVTLTTSHTDTPGPLTIAVNDDSLMLPILARFNVLSEFEWDRKYGTEGAGGGIQSGVIRYGTAQSATGTTLVIDAAAAFADNELIGCVVAFTDSNGASGVRVITDNVGATDTLTVDTWTTTPSGTISYWIFAGPPSNATNLPAVNVTQWLGTAAATPSVAGVPEVDVTHVSGSAEDLPTATVLGTPAGADIATDIAAVKTDTAAILTDTGTSGVPITTRTGFLKNTAALFQFTMTDSTNHAPATGLTVTATRSIDGAAYAACANAVAEVSGGNYKITLATTDLNGDTIALRFTAAASDDLNVLVRTQV